MKLRELYQQYSEQLTEIYSEQEAGSLAFWLLEEYLGKTRMDILKDESLTSIPLALEEAFEQVLKGKPIQYVLGHAPFYGREFLVSPSVLIPRNETEELVHLIIKENRDQSLRILDIGTGSGCIPISLALEIPKADVFALDVSPEALEVAEANAKKLGAKVEFFLCDILREEIPVGKLDIIVSNPPYVRHTEKSQMHANVLDHEPHLALFVYDEDPLLFYRTIAEKAKKALRAGGKLYFEINEAFGKETAKLLHDLGYTNVRIVSDLNGKERMVTAKSAPIS